MAAPWEKYATAEAQEGPWSNYTDSAPTYDRKWNRADADRQQREFMRQEKGNKTIKEKAKEVSEYIEPIARPTISGTLSLLGGAAGLASPVPGGTIVGGTLGYAGGQQLGDLIFGERGTDTSTTGQLKQAGADLYEGAQGEILGLGLGAGVSKAAGSLANLKRPTPLISMAEKRARAVIPSLTDLNPQEAANAAKAQALTDKLGVELTPAQRTGKPALQSLEQGLATTDPEFAAALNARDTTAKQKALAQVQQKVGKARPLPQPRDLQTTGQNTVEAIEGALKPVKEAERAAWESVPNYPIPSRNFDEAADAIKQTPLEADTEAAVTKILDYAGKLPRTTQGLQAIERTINDKMYAPGADKNIKRILGNLKQAINDDFKAMGTAADAGDIAIDANGRVVYPSELQKQIGRIDTRMSEIKAISKPDMDAVRSELQAKGVHPSQYQSVDRYDTGADKRAIETYQRMISPDLPTISGNAKEIEKLAADRITLQNQIESLKPAEDVAAAYRAAKDVSSERFKRFGASNVEKVLKEGKESSGRRLADENVNRQFFTPSGAAQLKRAVGANQAKEQMKPFVIADIIKQASKDGVTFNAQSGINYIQKNRAALEQLGLTGEVKQLLKDQFPAELEKMLAKRAPESVSGQQFFTGQDMRNILQQYGNTIKQLYGAETLQAFRDYNSLMGMIERKNLIPRGAGSNTAEKAMAIANAMIAKSGGPEQKLTEGLLSAILQGGGGGGALGFNFGAAPGTAATGAAIWGGKRLIQNMDKRVAQIFGQILKDATLNPQVAKDLMSVRKTGKVPLSLSSIIDKLKDQRGLVGKDINNTGFVNRMNFDGNLAEMLQNPSSKDIHSYLKTVRQDRKNGFLNPEESLLRWAMDTDGNIYFADSNKFIHKNIIPSGKTESKRGAVYTIEDAISLIKDKNK